VAFPLKLGAVYGVVKEISRAEDRPLLVAGRLAPELARELRAGGDLSAVRTGGPPDDVEAVLLVVGDDLTEDDERVLKAARRAKVPTLVVAAGRDVPEHVPYVLATDVVRAEPGHGFPLDAIAAALAAKLGERATSLARHLPFLRGAVCKQLIDSFARKNGIVGAAVFIPGADLPLLTLNQIRLVLRICAAYGLPVDNSRAPEVLATVGAGLGLRAVARELLDFVPVAGWLLKGAVAYAGTRAVGEAAVRYCEERVRRPRGVASPSSS
jgi:uncharacterized protein (DUF697 family)